MRELMEGTLVLKIVLWGGIYTYLSIVSKSVMMSKGLCVYATRKATVSPPVGGSRSMNQLFF